MARKLTKLEYDVLKAVNSPMGCKRPINHLPSKWAYDRLYKAGFFELLGPDYDTAVMMTNDKGRNAIIEYEAGD